MARRRPLAPPDLRGDERALRRHLAAYAPVLRDEEFRRMSEQDAPKRAKKQDAEAEAMTAPVQEAADRDAEQGYAGIEVDPTPNRNYTVEGVTSGAPTPETDAETRAAAEAHAAEVAKTARTAGG